MIMARDIYQEHLDRVSRALWDLDFEVLLQALAVPNQMYTADTGLVCDTEADLKDAIVEYRSFLARAGAQDYHRIVRWARFHPHHDGRIDGEHDTYVLRGGQYALEPFVSSQVLILQNDVWRGIECRSQVRNATCTVLSPTLLRKAAQPPDTRAVGG